MRVYLCLMRFWLVVTILITVAFTRSSAQFANVCIDSTFGFSQFAFCDQVFEPVCGCNQETYLNAHCAYMRAGVTQYQLGPCGNIASFLMPNTFTGLEPIRVFVSNRYEDNINIEVKDLNGMLYFQDHYSGLLNLQTSYNFSGYPKGLYFMFIYNSTEFQIHKFIIWEP